MSTFVTCLSLLSLLAISGVYPHRGSCGRTSGTVCIPTACHLTKCQLFSAASCVNDQCGCSARFFNRMADNKTYQDVTKMCISGDLVLSFLNFTEGLGVNNDEDAKYIYDEVSSGALLGFFKQFNLLVVEIMADITAYLKTVTESQPTQENIDRLQEAHKTLHSLNRIAAHDQLDEDTKSAKLSVAATKVAKELKKLEPQIHKAAEKLAAEKQAGVNDDADSDALTTGDHSRVKRAPQGETRQPAEAETQASLAAVQAATAELEALVQGTGSAAPGAKPSVKATKKAPKKATKEKKTANDEDRPTPADVLKLAKKAIADAQKILAKQANSNDEDFGTKQADEDSQLTKGSNLKQSNIDDALAEFKADEKVLTEITSDKGKYSGIIKDGKVAISDKTALSQLSERFSDRAREAIRQAGAKGPGNSSVYAGAKPL